MLPGGTRTLQGELRSVSGRRCLPKKRSKLPVARQAFLQLLSHFALPEQFALESLIVQVGLPLPLPELLVQVCVLHPQPRKLLADGCGGRRSRRLLRRLGRRLGRELRVALGRGHLGVAAVRAPMLCVKGALRWIHLQSLVLQDPHARAGEPTAVFLVALLMAAPPACWILLHHTHDVVHMKRHLSSAIGWRMSFDHDRPRVLLEHEVLRKALGALHAGL
mmetsp:Transcript_50190/g.131356  ORF Transcript_50190/g.131356 Transcript_50190/m.131356 type:complete len:220 (-) Transcript_50190:48-707(-)